MAQPLNMEHIAALINELRLKDGQTTTLATNGT